MSSFPKDFHIKRATPRDVDAIRALTRNAYAKWIPLIGREPLPMSADYESVISQHRFDLLYKNETLAALIETIAREDYLHIQNLCVAPDFQRLGLGGKLLNCADDMAAAKNLPELQLDTNSFFTGNVDLYRRHGFSVDWEKPMDVGAHVHMSKQLRKDG